MLRLVRVATLVAAFGPQFGNPLQKWGVEVAVQAALAIARCWTLSSGVSFRVAGRLGWCLGSWGPL